MTAPAKARQRKNMRRGLRPIAHRPSSHKELFEIIRFYSAASLRVARREWIRAMQWNWKPEVRCPRAPLLVSVAIAAASLATSAMGQTPAGAPPQAQPNPTPTSQTPQPAPAAHLSLDRAIELALQHNHTLLAARTTIDQNRAQEITANLRPNPVLTGDAQFLPIFAPSDFDRQLHRPERAVRSWSQLSHRARQETPASPAGRAAIRPQ